MTVLLDPVRLIDRLAADLPAALHGNLYLTGSLAAAYHFKAKLDRHGVNTKDADVVVHPAGNVPTTRDLAMRLLTAGWWRDPAECFPRPSPDPRDDLRAIRLYPPGSHDYFVEFLNVPEAFQPQAKDFLPIELNDGWYGLPSFQYMAVTRVDRLASHTGLRYAAPEMMALSNLLSHPTVGTQRIRTGTMRGKLRAAKDLGRVIALAWLAERETAAGWVTPWSRALRTVFPDHAADLARRAGDGLRDLLADTDALHEAWETAKLGLLASHPVTPASLDVTGQRLLADAIDPLPDAVAGQT